MIRPLLVVAAFATLAGCVRPYSPANQQPYPVVPEPAAVYVEPAPIPVTPIVGVSGLQSREPDVCSAQQYRSAVGQPGSAIPGLGVTRDYRIVQYRGIEPQDYDPQRVVFRLDASGNIQQVDCG